MQDKKIMLTKCTHKSITHVILCVLNILNTFVVFYTTRAECITTLRWRAGDVAPQGACGTETDAEGGRARIILGHQLCYCVSKS